MTTSFPISRSLTTLLSSQRSVGREVLKNCCVSCSVPARHAVNCDCFSNSKNTSSCIVLKPQLPRDTCPGATQRCPCFQGIQILRPCRSHPLLRMRIRRPRSSTRLHHRSPPLCRQSAATTPIMQTTTVASACHPMLPPLQVPVAVMGGVVRPYFQMNCVCGRVSRRSPTISRHAWTRPRNT